MVCLLYICFFIFFQKFESQKSLEARSNKVFKQAGLEFIKINFPRDDNFDGIIEFHVKSSHSEKSESTFLLHNHIKIHKKENVSFFEQVKEILTLCQGDATKFGFKKSCDVIEEVVKYATE